MNNDLTNWNLFAELYGWDQACAERMEQKLAIMSEGEESRVHLLLPVAKAIVVVAKPVIVKGVPLVIKTVCAGVSKLSLFYNKLSALAAMIFKNPALYYELTRMSVKLPILGITIPYLTYKGGSALVNNVFFTEEGLKPSSVENFIKVITGTEMAKRTIYTEESNYTPYVELVYPTSCNFKMSLVNRELFPEASFIENKEYIVEFTSTGFIMLFSWQYVRKPDGSTHVQLASSHCERIPSNTTLHIAACVREGLNYVCVKAPGVLEKHFFDLLARKDIEYDRCRVDESC